MHRSSAVRKLQFLSLELEMCFGHKRCGLGGHRFGNNQSQEKQENEKFLKQVYSNKFEVIQQFGCTQQVLQRNDLSTYGNNYYINKHFMTKK